MYIYYIYIYIYIYIYMFLYHVLHRYIMLIYYIIYTHPPRKLGISSVLTPTCAVPTPTCAVLTPTCAVLTLLCFGNHHSSDDSSEEEDDEIMPIVIDNGHTSFKVPKSFSLACHTTQLPNHTQLLNHSHHSHPKPCAGLD
jgi:hypothetical protein